MKAKQVKDFLNEGVFDALGSSYDAFSSKSKQPSSIKKQTDNSNHKSNEDCLTDEGVLNKLEYGEDLVYYVTFSHKNVRLSNKFIESYGEENLDALIGKSRKWELSEWDKFAHRPEEKFRVVGIINYR